MNCPVCRGIYSDMFKFLTCEVFDESFLYKDVTVHKCNNCGHKFNQLSDYELKNLAKYYEEEYAPSNLSATDEATDRPGAENEDRYEEIIEFISPHVKVFESRILDIGCATGGFLKYCETKGWFNTFGIDPIEAYVEASGMENVKVGNVYKIPFEDNSFDIVILEHVLEHLNDPHLALHEIHRVLDKGGLLYISVPDADRYDNEYFYLMKEHIQHYNIVGLKFIAQQTGYELINYKESEIDMIGNLKCPTASALLKVTGEIYCWGIGRDFFYYYPHTRLKRLKLILVDDTPDKQKRTFKGMKIHSSEILKEASEDSFLIITAFPHRELLKKKAKELGYKGEIIDI